ncbi:hypothetical protein [Persephonella sp.]
MGQTEKDKLIYIYELKSEIGNHLQELKKELTFIIETILRRISNGLDDFEKFFKEKEYIDLNMFLSKYISILENPVLSKDSPGVLLIKEKDQLEKNLEKIINRLNFTKEKIEKYIEKGIWIQNQLSFHDYMKQVKKELEGNLEKAITRTLRNDIMKLKQKLKGIENINSYEDILNFKKQIESEINFYITHEIFPKVNNIFFNYKKDLAKKIDTYIQKASLNSELKEKLNEELSLVVEEFKIKPSQFFYSSPEINPSIFNYEKHFSEIEILKENISSVRFIVTFTIGLILTFIGILLSSKSHGLVILGFGVLTVVYSFIDSIYFNDYFKKKYILSTKNRIKNEFEKSIDNLKDKIKENLIKLSDGYEKNIALIIKNETKDIENYLLTLNKIHNIFERYIDKLQFYKDRVREA